MTTRPFIAHRAHPWLLAAALGLAAATPVQAATCRIITYYSTAELEQPVGVWSNCPGMKGLSGRRTRYREVSVEQSPEPINPPGQIPCEFQENCEVNLPTPIVVEPPKEDPPKKDEPAEPAEEDFPRGRPRQR